MYSKFSKVMKVNSASTKFDADQFNYKRFLKPHHHIRLDKEFKSDCSVWVQFLEQSSLGEVVNRPMINLLEPDLTSRDLFFYSDTSGATNLGYGAVYDNR